MEQTQWIFGFLLVFLYVGKSQARHEFKETQKHKDTEYKKALEGLIEFYRQRSYEVQERKKRDAQNVQPWENEGNSTLKRNGESLGPHQYKQQNSSPLGSGHGDDIDKKDIDPNSKLTSLLESMLDEHNGKTEKAKGIKPWLKKNVIAENHDHHLYTHRQRVMYGLESEREFEEDGANIFGNTISSYLWEQAIVPYEIDNNSFNSGQVNTILRAMEEMRTKTCVDFRARSSALSSQLGHNSFVYFFNDGGCYSYVGRVFNGRQDLSLGTPGCVTNAITLHEMCHAIGQHHEQSRSDRDKYVRILWENVRCCHNNLAKQSTQDNNPYDAESVLQYNIYAFSSNGRKTIEFKDSRLEFLADTADGLEFYDVQDIIDGYGCADGCTSPPTCQHKGFVNHLCSCVCPRAITGSVCETIVTDQGCGGEITLSVGVPVEITSPNYPNNYVTGTTCVWYITSPGDYHIQMTIEDLHLSDQTDNRCYHWLEVQHNLIGQTGFRRCGDIESRESTVSSLDSRNDMMLIFDSAYASDRPASKGFNITLQTTLQACLSNPCAYGTCSSDVSSEDYTCNCFNGFSGTNCDVVAANIDVACSFEAGSQPCFLVDDDTDNFDWALHSGETISSGTGPSAAYEGFIYLYAETSYPRVSGDVARLKSDLQFLPTLRCLKFWYNMHGQSVKDLIVSYSSATSSKTMLWSASGDKGNVWLNQNVDIPEENDIVIYMEAVRGVSWNADIAIDAVSLIHGPCNNPCNSGPCLNNGVCNYITTTTYSCDCVSGYTGPVCDTEVKPCDSNPCLNNGTCTNIIDGTTYACGCASGYTGQDCDTEVKPCDSNPCLNNGTCTNIINGTTYACGCVSGYTGQDCDTEVKPCDSNPCMNNGTCTNIINGTTYACGCVSGYTGQDCDTEVKPCDSNPCLNNGTCTNIVNGTTYACGCVSGYTGQDCDTEVKPCDSNPCLNNGTCTNIINGTTYACGCVSGYTGQDCDTKVRPCDSNPCLNNGTCTNIINGTTYACGCVSGYTGQDCDTEVRPCDSNPCLNNGTCTNIINGTTYACGCVSGYTGEDCDTEVKPCDSNPCLNNGTCTNIINGTTYACGCVSGYTGQDCDTEVKPCDSNPCLNNGTCTNIINGTTYACGCVSGYTGQDCDTEVRPCDSNPCLNNGTCTNIIYGTKYACGCVSGYTGQDCDTEVKPCNSNPCLNNGTCTNIINGTTYACGCVSGYTGQNCDSEVKPCDSNPCLNNGTCTNIVNGTTYACGCVSGYTGQDCDTEVSPVNMYNCTFEDGNVCFFVNDNMDDFDWTLRSGPTPSGAGGQLTGPSGAFEGVTYSYTEMTFPRKNGDIARLITTANFTSSEKCLGLAYHMYGSNVGSLSIQAASVVLWQTSGSNTREWNQVVVNVPAISNLMLSIEVQRAESWMGDIAIDNIWMRNGTCECDSSPCQNGGTCVVDGQGGYNCQCGTGYHGETCESVSDVVKCTFEDGESCIFSGDRNGTFQWIKGNGPTPTPMTGPSSASHGNAYMFIESSSPRRNGDVAVLSSTVNFKEIDKCLTFDYHMYGQGIGTLNVIIDSIVWSRSGNQGNQWKRGGVALPANADLQIKFEAVRGSTDKGDISLDNLVISPGRCGCLSFPCYNGGTCIPKQNTVDYTCICTGDFGGANCDSISASTTLNCNFEKNQACFLRQSSQDDWDWTLMSGPTPTAMTGPLSAAEGSRYAYLETSSRKYKSVATLDTGHLRFEPAPRCLQFSYYMYGVNAYQLHVYAGEREGRIRKKAKIIGNQGENWIKTKINMDSVNDLYFYINAKVGSGPHGDIAIDDVRLLPGKC